MNVEEFRCILVNAVDGRGSFLPILGSEVSTSEDWADAPTKLLEYYGQGPGRSVQAAEIKRAKHVECLTGTAVRELPADRFAAKTWDENAEIRLEGYLSKLGQDKRECEMPEGHVPGLLALQRDITALGYVLTFVWAQALVDAPRPLGAGFADEPAEAGLVSDLGLDQVLRACLDDCLALQSLPGWPAAEPPMLKIEWVYEKLLLLAARVLGPAASEFWLRGDRAGFAECHRPFIEDHEDGGACGWSWKADSPAPKPWPTHSESGVRLSHVLWTEALRNHCILAGTRKYRTSREVAFFLALDDRVTDLPDVAADPFETGLVYSEHLSRDHHAEDMDLDLLRSLYEYCSYMPDGSVRPPDALHQALARLVHRSDKCERESRSSTHGTNKQRPRGRTTEKCSQVILSMSLDLEMERALEQVFDVYRVMLPVAVPLRATPANNLKSLRYQGTWIVAEFRSGESGAGRRPRTPWVLLQQMGDDRESAVSIDGEGPLLIKLFGSPLHEIGDSSQFSAGEIETARPIPLRHAVVMDEADLLERLFSLPSGLGGLKGRLLASETAADPDMFFFGQDALTWSSRTPFLLVTRMPGQCTDRSQQAAGNRAVSLGEADLAGDSTLRRLRIARPEGETELSEFARKVMEEAMRDE